MEFSPWHDTSVRYACGMWIEAYRVQNFRTPTRFPNWLIKLCLAGSEAGVEPGKQEIFRLGAYLDWVCSKSGCDLTGSRVGMDAVQEETPTTNVWLGCLIRYIRHGRISAFLFNQSIFHHAVANTCKSILWLKVSANLLLRYYCFIEVIKFIGIFNDHWIGNLTRWKCGSCSTEQTQLS